MITVLTGTNSFEMNEALQAIVAQFEGTAERIDGADLELKQLPDLVMGGTLFAEKRLVIIRGLSENKTLWEKLPEWLPRVSDDVHLVLVETKPDKRTSAYKELKKAADVREFAEWTDRDRALADAWVQKRAESQGVKLDKKLAHHIVERVGLDQWQLAQALDKLALADTIDVATIEALIDANPAENIFQLFETALNGDSVKLHEMLQTLELTEDPYQLFALLSSQAFQLAGITYAGPDQNPAQDLAIHPFVASKLSRHARKIGKSGAARILKAFAKADADMKRSRGEPWLLIERTLLEVSTI